ncbi:heme-binding domain-containing protein [Jiulongibacter sp. NS-SX5]|uniref:heme-binding domain-containing protein n=1 Tax=Jiulongibacter sp. NS-SX5 TaxID=3463854 RepID=UPI004058D011
MIKKILLALLVVLLIIQFIKPERNVSDTLSENDITTKYDVPENVKIVLDKACNDCHSNNTKYPWYANLQPAAWILADHIEDGKRHLDFSEFAAYEPWKAHHKLEEIAEEIEKDGMPLDDYVFMHKEADLSDEEKRTLITWATGLMKVMEADSTIDLTRPQRKPSAESH